MKGVSALMRAWSQVALIGQTSNGFANVGYQGNRRLGVGDLSRLSQSANHAIGTAGAGTLPPHSPGENGHAQYELLSGSVTQLCPAVQQSPTQQTMSPPQS